MWLEQSKGRGKGVNEVGEITKGLGFPGEALSKAFINR